MTENKQETICAAVPPEGARFGRQESIPIFAQWQCERKLSLVNYT
jgi:hypothetical protein